MKGRMAWEMVFQSFLNVMTSSTAVCVAKEKGAALLPRLVV